MTKFDIIGDIHGHADELFELLDHLGYRNRSGIHTHPTGRKAVFLGDFIDRGPKIRDVLKTVRKMVDAGEAVAILGNHEVNAMRFYAVGRDGKFLRPHTEKNIHQHKATLEQFPDRAEWMDWIRWFAGLPLSLDLGGIRAVHACWSETAIRELSGIGRLEGGILEAHSHADTRGYDLISQLLNGPEGVLPDGYAHETADGTMRAEFRLKWWRELRGATCKEAIFPSPPNAAQRSAVPNLPPKSIQATFPHPQDAPPTFFGHYALKDPVPRPILPNLACLDYGIGKGGFLCAYRWDGEDRLDPRKFLTQPSD